MLLYYSEVLRYKGGVILSQWPHFREEIKGFGLFFQTKTEKNTEKKEGERKLDVPRKINALRKSNGEGRKEGKHTSETNKQTKIE